AGPAADVLPDGDVVVHRERRWGAFGEHLQLVDHRLHLAGGQLRVFVALGPAPHRAGDPDAVLIAQLVRFLAVAEDDLHHPGGIPQIDEGHASVVPPPGHPPGERYGAVNVTGAQDTSLMGTDHDFSLRARR